MANGSEVMCRKKVDIPWSIDRGFTVLKLWWWSNNKLCKLKLLLQKVDAHLPLNDI